MHRKNSSRVSGITTLATIAMAALLAAALGCGKREPANKETPETKSTTAPGSAEREPAKTKPLFCYVGGTMRPVMEELVKRYEAKTGQKIDLDFADSGQLQIRIEQTGMGDLHVAHDPFPDRLMRRGLGQQTWITAVLTPVIVVSNENPKGIAGFRDLAKPGVRVVVTDRIYSTAGHVVAVIARKADIEKQLDANTVLRPRSGGEAANQVTLGLADAAICWNAVAYLRRDSLKVVPIEPQFMPVADADAFSSATFGRVNPAQVSVAISTLKCSKQPAAAQAFAEFAASPDNAKVWTDFGFSPAPAAPSRPAAKALTGSILVHCAAGMRLPVSQLADEFSSTRGVKVETTYSGSNILLGQIELTRTGDVYIAGDADYIDMAAKKNLVQSRRAICYFVPVIMVAKDNPRQIRTLGDLAREGIRIGQGDEKAAAVGRIMPRLLQLNGIDEKAWNSSVALSSPTVTELALQMRLGHIDAAVVWQSIAAQFAQDTDIVPISPEKNVVAEVAGAVLVFTRNPDAASAFLEFLTSPRGRQVLTENQYAVDKP